MLKVDLDLLAKYDRKGPRYTSYPTAPQFDRDFTEWEFLHEIEHANQFQKRDLSLYCHIPFCKQLCYFCGCHTQITRNRDRIQTYVDYLIREIEMMAGHVHSEKEVIQVHFGGGTPTYLQPRQLDRLMGTIRKEFPLSPESEIGLEVDPRNVGEEHMGLFSDHGVNRMSFGVQSFDRSVQEMINRIQTVEETRWCMERAREIGVKSVNIDLIYGLPGQTEQTFSETLETVIGLCPDRMAVYNYAHVPWKKKHQKAIPEDKLPEPREKLKLLKQSIETLTEAGYEFIGMDHFARPDDPLAQAQKNGTLQRNFQGYFTHGGSDLLGLGQTGISVFEGAYAQNHRDRSLYYQDIDAKKPATFRGYKLTRDDCIRRFVIMELMCNLQVKKDRVEKRYDIDFDRYFQSELTDLERFTRDGLLDISDHQITIREAGRIVIRNICMSFDQYLKTSSDSDTPAYSSTV